MTAFQELKGPLVANDSGFFVHGLKGFPATFVNFALGTIDVEGILRLVVGPDRRCEFRHALAFDDGDGGPYVFSDVVPGTLATRLRGKYEPEYHWSRLVLIFIPDSQSKTLGEMSLDEYVYWSEHQRPQPTYADMFLDWYRAHRTSTLKPMEG